MNDESSASFFLSYAKYIIISPVFKQGQAEFQKYCILLQNYGAGYLHYA